MKILVDAVSKRIKQMTPNRSNGELLYLSFKILNSRFILQICI